MKELLAACAYFASSGHSKKCKKCKNKVLWPNSNQRHHFSILLLSPLHHLDNWCNSFTFCICFNANFYFFNNKITEWPKKTATSKFFFCEPFFVKTLSYSCYSLKNTHFWHVLWKKFCWKFRFFTLVPPYNQKVKKIFFKFCLK